MMDLSILSPEQRAEYRSVCGPSILNCLISSSFSMVKKATLGGAKSGANLNLSSYKSNSSGSLILHQSASYVIADLTPSSLRSIANTMITDAHLYATEYTMSGVQPSTYNGGIRAKFIINSDTFGSLTFQSSKVNLIFKKPNEWYEGDGNYNYSFGKYELKMSATSTGSTYYYDHDLSSSFDGTIIFSNASGSSEPIIIDLGSPSLYYHENPAYTDYTNFNYPYTDGQKIQHTIQLCKSVGDSKLEAYMTNGNSVGTITSSFAFQKVRNRNGSVGGFFYFPSYTGNTKWYSTETATINFTNEEFPPLTNASHTIAPNGGLDNFDWFGTKYKKYSLYNWYMYANFGILSFFNNDDIFNISDYSKRINGVPTPFYKTENERKFLLGKTNDDQDIILTCNLSNEIDSSALTGSAGVYLSTNFNLIPRYGTTFSIINYQSDNQQVEQSVSFLNQSNTSSLYLRKERVWIQRTNLVDGTRSEPEFVDVDTYSPNGTSLPGGTLTNTTHFTPAENEMLTILPIKEYGYNFSLLYKTGALSSSFTNSSSTVSVGTPTLYGWLEGSAPGAPSTTDL